MQHPAKKMHLPVFFTARSAHPVNNLISNLIKKTPNYFSSQTIDFIEKSNLYTEHFLFDFKLGVKFFFESDC